MKLKKKIQKMTILRLNQSVFDHTISNLKLNVSDVLKLYESLESMSDVNLRRISESTAKELNVSKKIADALISYYRVFQEDKEVDVKRYCIYLITQTYRRPVSRLSNEKIRDSFPFSPSNSDRTPSKKKKKSRYSSPQPSPPSPRCNVLKLRLDDANARIRFFRKCLLNILNVLANEEGRVDREDVDRLSLVLRGTVVSRPLSSLCEDEWESESKLGEDTMTLEDLKSWIERCLVTEDELSRDAIVVSHESGGPTIVVKSENDEKCPRDLVIQNCTNVRIHVPFDVRFASLVGCNRCSVLIGAVSKICSVEHCEHVDITVATRSLRVLNTVHSTLHSFCTTRPFLLGDCRSIRLAPHNLIYSHVMKDFVRRANLRDEDENFWNRALDCTNMSTHHSHPPLSPSSSAPSKASAFSELPCADFVTFALSIDRTTKEENTDTKDSGIKSKTHHQTMFCLPRKYSSALQERRNRVVELRRMIASAGLSLNQTQDVQDAIVSRFEKWLYKSSKRSVSLLDR